MTTKKFSNPSLIILLLGIALLSTNVTAESRYFETEGVADIMKETTFTSGAEARNVPIPAMIDISLMSEYSGIYTQQKTKSGWAQCIVPLKGSFGITGAVNRYLTFKCKPLS